MQRTNDQGMHVVRSPAEQLLKSKKNLHSFSHTPIHNHSIHHMVYPKSGD